MARTELKEEGEKNRQMNKNKIMGYLSSLGRSLMMPIAALAAAGILLGLTSALLKPQVLESVSFLSNPVVLYSITTLKNVAGVVFTLIPVLFAISISLGLAEDDKEIAAFAGFVGYYTFLVSASAMLGSGFFEFASMRVVPILGVETLDMGAIGGIMTGIIVSILHNKYRTVQFPVAIAFYGGKRFVTIIVILVMALVDQVAPFIWSPVSLVITNMGNVIANAGSRGVFIFGLLERLLIPTGLHHVLNSVFRTTSIGGVFEGVEGSLNIFLQFIDKVEISLLAPYTRFLAQGKFPFMMFGLPAASLAIYRTTPDKNKAAVKSILIAAVAPAFVSGITEPVEFAFMFIAPVLFLFHAVMGGLSFMLMSVLGVIIGNTGGGIIDFVIWGVFQPGSRWFMVIPVGVVYALVYYYVFKYYFMKKILVIETSEEDLDLGTSKSQDDPSALAQVVIAGIGGFSNIVKVNNCISRLRIDIVDIELIDENILKKSGSLGIVKASDNHIHVIYGPKVDHVANVVKQALKY